MLGLTELLDDQRFVHNQDRTANRDEAPTISPHAIRSSTESNATRATS